MMNKTRIVAAFLLFLAALICVGLAAPPGGGGSQSNQPAEDACLHAYDVCYSNWDTAYRHCMHGAGVDFAPLKKHPIVSVVTGNPNKTTSAATPTPTPRRTGTVPPVNKSASTPTPTPKKHKG